MTGAEAVVAICIVVAVLLGGLLGWLLARGKFCLIFILMGAAAHAASPENQALALVVADLQGMDAGDAIFTRYIWIEGAAHEDLQAVSLTMNYFGLESTIYKPLPLGKDKLMVVRVDLRHYAGRSVEDINRMIKTWEEFQFDPKFSLLITKDTLKFLDLKVVPTVKKTVQERKLVDVKPYVWTDGKTYTKDYRTVNKVVEVPFATSGEDVVRIPSEHIDLVAYELAASLTQSQAPLVSHPYFITRGLSAIQTSGIAGREKDDGVYKTIYGGLYYELAGVRAAGKKGTDLDLLFEDLGIGSVEAGLTAEKVFDRLRSDQRVAVFKSGITAKPRFVEILPTLVSLNSQAIVALTGDNFDEDIDIDRHPLMNLLKPKVRAREVIFVKANGLHGFALFNEQGKLQREVPFNVANDTTIPNPHTKRLEPGISCIRCHAQDRGWRTLTNDVPKLLRPHLDIFGDNAAKRRPADDTINRLVGLYSGNVEQSLLPRARDDYATAVLRATGPWKKSLDQLDTVELASARLEQIVNDYKYRPVNAARALLEMGYEFKPGSELEVLRELLPPVNVVIDGIIPEDPRIGALKAGLAINRSDWDLVYSFAATRAAKVKK